jgi:integrase family protein
MNKKCTALTDDEYKQVIDLLRNGFVYKEHIIRPNERIATIAVLETTLGLRLGDVLKLRLSSFMKDNNNWKIDIVEQKTGKRRTFTVPVEIYSFIQNYAINNSIGVDAKLFDISERQVQRHLRMTFDKAGLDIRHKSSHTFRKTFSQRVYIDSNYNIELVRVLLQHSSIATTQKYLGIQPKQVEEALAKTSNYLI